ncbi:MAG: phytanoyl-CoA dioxygenase family protein [Gammaproteobacteria bacterium]|nr:phytanoyl-CoA dioxygenase family protein [Gammaproteobacteria bacterium]
MARRVTMERSTVAVVHNAFGKHELKRFDYAAAAKAGDETAFDADVLGALDRHGFVVIENAVPAADCTQLVAEMRPYIDATPHGLHGLGGTRRVGALVARSPTSHRFVAHRAILRLAQSVLGEQRLSGDAVRIGDRTGKGEKGFRYPWQLHLTQIIDVGPGGGTDAMPHHLKMHRANGMWVHNFEDAGLDPQMEVMWSLSPFTKENGATHIVLGSHRDQPRGGPKAHREPTIQAEMEQGSVLVWTGWSVHGAGTNTSTERRIGMNINYALAFLAQEENQLLACPPHLARELPESLQRLIGYRQPAGALNYVAECQAPADSVLKEDFDVLVPGAHGHDMDATTDGPTFAPQDETAFAAKLADLEARKARAVATDELELALHLKHAISVLRRSPRL